MNDQTIDYLALQYPFPKGAFDHLVHPDGTVEATLHAQAILERLDYVFDGAYAAHTDADGTKYMCAITVYLGGTPVTRGTYGTDPGDALFRTATLWGIGRYLTDRTSIVDSWDELIPTTDKTRKFLHAAGRELYADAWDKKRPELVYHVTKGRTQSSAVMTEAEARRLAQSLKARGQ